MAQPHWARSARGGKRPDLHGRAGRAQRTRTRSRDEGSLAGPLCHLRLQATDAQFLDRFRPNITSSWSPRRFAIGSACCARCMVSSIGRNKRCGRCFRKPKQTRDRRGAASSTLSTASCASCRASSHPPGAKGFESASAIVRFTGARPASRQIAATFARNCCARSFCPRRGAARMPSPRERSEGRAVKAARDVHGAGIPLRLSVCTWSPLAQAAATEQTPVPRPRVRASSACSASPA